jgi:hypothetical protein
MLRPSRPLTIALLWVAIVLLPVRGWAAAAMPMAMMDGHAAMVQAADDAHRSASVPCHGEHHPDSDTAAQTCSLCDVCHSAFAGLPAAELALPVLPPARPCDAAVRPVEPAAHAGPERPPRIVLA